MTEKYRGQISLANLTIEEMMRLAHISVGDFFHILLGNYLPLKPES